MPTKPSPDNTSNPLITVITPAYNVRPYIAEAVDSVLAQTEARFEYLIVDDGSTDGTVEYVREASAVDDRIRLIETPHGGSGAARNAALREAKGEFIAFLDGDDRWHVEFLAKQLADLESVGSEYAAVFCRARVMNEGGTVLFARWQRGGKFDFDDMLVLNCPPRNGSSLLIRRSAFESAGEFDVSLKSGVDFDMWLRMMRLSESPYFWGSSSYLLDLRIRPGAISTNWDSRFKFMEQLLDLNVAYLQRTPPGLAYIRPAILAYRAGYDSIADEWMQQVRSAPLVRVLRDQFGVRVLLWAAIGSAGRSVVRQAMRFVKKSAGRGLSTGGKIVSKGLTKTRRSNPEA